jgi:hypothetical protein
MKLNSALRPLPLLLITALGAITSAMLLMVTGQCLR